VNRPSLLVYAFVGFALMGTLTTVAAIVERALVPAVPVEGRYLSPPGNRFTCPETNAKGQPYIGWFGSQADGSNKPVKFSCVYASARVM